MATLTLTSTDLPRFLRYFHFAVLVLACLIWLASETLWPAQGAEAPFVVYALYALACADAAAALWHRHKWTASSAEALRLNPESEQALTEWLKGQLVPLPMAVGIALMGLAARVSGAAPAHAGVLFVGAIALLLALRPAEPLR